MRHPSTISKCFCQTAIEIGPGSMLYWKQCIVLCQIAAVIFSHSSRNYFSTCITYLLALMHLRTTSVGRVIGMSYKVWKRENGANGLYWNPEWRRLCKASCHTEDHYSWKRALSISEKHSQNRNDDTVLVTSNGSVIALRRVSAIWFT